MIKINNPELNSRQLLALYLQQDFQQVSANFINILAYFEKITYLELETDVKYFINVFIKNFLFLFTQPDYLLPDAYVVRFIQLNPTIANLVAISSYQTTDAYLEILKNQTHNFAKILVLYSARNQVKIDYQLLFNAHPQFACLWYSSFLETYRSSLLNQKAYQNLKQHLEYQDSRLTDFYHISEVYLGATYIDPILDQAIKQKLNKSIQKSPFCTTIIIHNQPNFNEIAIVTCFAYLNKFDFEALKQLVKSLEITYQVTVINAGKKDTEFDLGDFKNIEYIQFEDGNFNLASLKNNQFIAVYYPNLSISPETIILANFQLAPIQIAGTEYPLSSWGSKINYYFSSIEIETRHNPEHNYSERLVLLPDYLPAYNLPDYALEANLKSRSFVIINCICQPQQLNYSFVSLLKRLEGKTETKVLYRFIFHYSESLGKNNSFIPFKQDLAEILGKHNCEIIITKSEQDYFESIAEGNFCIDTYHFSNFQSIIDSLYCRKPIVTLIGNKYYNRIGSYLLTQVGLTELIATNPQKYLKLIVNLVDQPEYRLKIEQKLNQINLEKILSKYSSVASCKQGIDFLIANHTEISQDNSKTPIKLS